MKIQKIIILAFAFVALIQCRKETKEPYANENIVIDNAQAALYFHIVFNEAENAWAFVNSIDYREDTYLDPASTAASSKELIYRHPDKGKDTVFIGYQNWTSNHLSMTGKIIVIFDNDSSYQKDGKTANILLADFSINDQRVVGEATIRYRRVGNNPDVPANDQYVYTLLSGSAIHEKGNSMPVLISCAIAGGQYERVEGGATPVWDFDDVWAYSGSMTGMIRENPDLRYTHTVTTATYMLGDETLNGRIHYTMDCRTARQGFSQIRVSGRPDIFYIYLCNELFFDSTTLHIR